MPDETPSQVPQPRTPKEHFGMFADNAADLLTGAYQRMVHPDLQECRDHLYIDVLLEVGKMQKAFSPKPAAGPHAQKLEDSDPELLNVALTFLIGIADAVGRTNTRFQKQLDTMTREVQAVQSLGDALSQRFMSNTQLGAAPPLEGGHEALLAQLWERHAGAIDQQPLMRLFQQLSGSSGPEGESLKVREQEVREMAVVNQTMYSGLQASNELIHSLQVLSEVQSAALRLGSQYMGLFKNQIPPLPGSGS